MAISAVGACACVGPQNGDPFCPCRMKRKAATRITPEKLRGLSFAQAPSNEIVSLALLHAADEIERLQSMERVGLAGETKLRFDPASMSYVLAEEKPE